MYGQDIGTLSVHYTYTNANSMVQLWSRSGNLGTRNWQYLELQVNVAHDFKVYDICRSGDIGTRDRQYREIQVNVAHDIKVYNILYVAVVTWEHKTGSI